MKLELINTGTELLIGDVVNTNAAWLGQQLCEIGIEVQQVTVVPDGDEINRALSEACSRSDVVVITGGLGPTADDVSREAAAYVFGLPLVRHEQAALDLQAYFHARGRTEINEHNWRQAQSPEGAELLINHFGTAPGWYLPSHLNRKSANPCHVFLLPGPPRELKPMVAAELMPRLQSMLGEQREPLATTYLRYTGIGESDVSMRLHEQLQKWPQLQVGYCIGKGDLDVRIRGPLAALEAATLFARHELKEFLISSDRRNLEQVLVELLQQKQQSVATAESCTGGFIASRLTDVSGSSQVFEAGWVTYSNTVKTQQLQVAPETLDEFGAVSAQVAQQMAEGCLRISGADHALAVTGVAGPTGGSEIKPVGTVYIALASKGYKTEVRLRRFTGERERFKIMTSQTALDFLRRRLCGYDLPQ